ncbi:ADPRH-like protein [Mya arenaria]|uniref:ADP-ribosylhydrolase ARH1 n=1 Tax=Mya arenaria TaxID=6604 RepID=A0ABY7FIX9_MYAAR|nr:ADP-ribosylhydrolase ARH1-like isoform X1 [Mya arenaria]XP_052772144.1 ADP-ribosylhydrolase ARH1-like isoform X1 [Mya arenaria]XP_052772145.1 ADP-ribosylhydrolase ARH1-like isoform X1 [Mya arenaria]XP_052772147.1 ADP-ribosylhydrolase ARH1-like isoform X1 [Mya arenaria]WAR20839.1 ADPRH-like protein [Mya arenaria]
MGGAHSRPSNAAVPLEERYMACMVLSGAGDALGYKKGKWEFNFSGPEIHRELKELGGLGNIQVNKDDFPVSDDTVMQLALAEALVQGKRGEDLYKEISTKFQECSMDMGGRAAGQTCMDAVYRMKQDRYISYRIPFNAKGGGCGAAMRSMCIGLLFPRPEEIQDLIEVSIESGRMTHNNPTGYLGALASALFTSYGIQQKPLVEWGKGLMDTLPLAMRYIEETGFDVENNKKHWDYFTDQWTKYLKLRQISDGKSKPVFPWKYGVKERDEFYKSISFADHGGNSGHDAPMIAYDAILSHNGTWTDLCHHGMFHGGDNDSTGVITGALFGALNGFSSVPEGNYKNLEYRDRLENIATLLFEMNHKDEAKTKLEEPKSIPGEAQQNCEDTKNLSGKATAESGETKSPTGKATE